LWENEWLKDEEVSLVLSIGRLDLKISMSDVRLQLPPSMLSEHAVILRMEAGSQEASYLAAFTPIPDTPMAVIIQYVSERVCWFPWMDF
jgi:hypothetical protein